MIREATTLDYIPIFQDNYIWVLQSPVERNVIAVDPGDATPLIEYLSKHQKTLQAIFITHHHADHTQGIAALKMRYQTPIYGPKTECIEGVTHAVQEGDVFHIASFPDAFTVLDIPGHTLGHIAYYFPGAVLCGDTLFSMGCGRLFEGTAEQMLHSLHKIAALPDDTKVYCTHEYTLKNLQFAARVLPDDTAIVEKLHQVMAILLFLRLK